MFIAPEITSTEGNSSDNIAAIKSLIQLKITLTMFDSQSPLCSNPNNSKS